MTESGYFNNGNFQEYCYFAEGGDFAVLKREFPVAQHKSEITVVYEN